MFKKHLIQPIAYTQLRDLDWEHCYHVCDLGGLPIINGGKTRWHSILRSDILGRLSINGQQALLDYGVQTIIDLRPPKEVQKEPSAFTKQTDSPNDLTYLNLPLEKYEPHVSALITQAKTRAEVYCIILDYYPDMGQYHARDYSRTVSRIAYIPANGICYAPTIGSYSGKCCSKKAETILGLSTTY